MHYHTRTSARQRRPAASWRRLRCLCRRTRWPRWPWRRLSPPRPPSPRRSPPGAPAPTRPLLDRRSIDRSICRQRGCRLNNGRDSTAGVSSNTTDKNDSQQQQQQQQQQASPPLLIQYRPPVPNPALMSTPKDHPKYRFGLVTADTLPPPSLPPSLLPARLLAYLPLATSERAGSASTECHLRSNPLGRSSQTTGSARA